MDDEIAMSFIPYNIDEIEKVKGWNGFISPEGIFYKVYEMDKIATGHDKYARMLAKRLYNIDLIEKFEKLKRTNQKLANYNLGEKDLLINICGFVNYQKISSDIEIKIPDFSFNGKKLTNKQILTLEKLAKVNNQSFIILAEKIMENYNIEYNNYSNVQRKILQK